MNAKTITFNRSTKDFDTHFDGQYIGSFATRTEAQIALDDHALYLIEQGLVDTPLALLEQPAVDVHAERIERLRATFAATAAVLGL
jgi:hypothetical protein